LLLGGWREWNIGAKAGPVFAVLEVTMSADLLSVPVNPLTEQFGIDAVFQCRPGNRNTRL